VNVASLALSCGVLVLAVGAYIAQLLRWLRVLQREHYEPGSVRRFYVRWAAPDVASARSADRARGRRPFPVTIPTLIAVAVFVVVKVDVVAVLVLCVYGYLFPHGLSIKGRTSALAWTRRMKTVTAVVVLESLLIASFVLVSKQPWIVVVLLLMAEPLLIDAAAYLTRPLEKRLSQKFVDQATTKLANVRPTIVAITGSFGKTSTKHHLAELLGGRRGVVPSPRSYNNRAGLSRAINENLGADTTVFIAEMGTYGPGEIASLCSWCPPDIAVITAIGPVHLERMGTLDVVEQAKFEITTRAPVVVVNTDDRRLAKWPEKLRAEGKRVVTAASADPTADVRVALVGERWQVTIDGAVAGIAPPVPGVREANLACAIAVARELRTPADEILARLSHLTSVPNRMVVATAPSGVMVIDDTFNANPSSAESALRTLRALPISGRRVLVTPGIIEMGREQYQANLAIAFMARSLGMELVAVGRTNELALAEGFDKPPRRFDTRDEAVAWVRTSLRPGDGVLYLNDLPDHYP
jgi:UDP-N-acetylmuramoyl-tripeptide--D-alanyl-D-alanine ligase